MFGIANRPVAMKQNGAPNAWVQFGSELLMVSGGVKSVYEPFLQRLEAMGGHANAAILSEVHACADLPAYDIEPFVERFNARYWVSRGKRRNAHSTSGGADIDVCGHGYGLRSTGFNFGSSVLLSVYEKRWEVRDNPTKLAIMEKVRWGGPMEKAVRVEFKVHRETLKARGIHTVDDWERSKGGFIRWLNEDWFRMTEGQVDRTNTSRAETWKTWRHVQELFAAWAGGGEKPLKLVNEVQAYPTALVKQAVGCLAQAMAIRGIVIKNMPEFLDWSVRMLRGYSSKEEVMCKLERKAKEFAAQHPKEAFFRWSGADAYASETRTSSVLPMKAVKQLAHTAASAIAAEPTKPDLRERERATPCERCGVETTDWMSVDNKTGKCKCNSCFQPGRKKAMDTYEMSVRALVENAQLKAPKREVSASEVQMAPWVCWAIGSDGESVVIDVRYEWEWELDQAV